MAETLWGIRYYPSPTVKTPTIEEVVQATSDGTDEATDGCHVESDGTCEHGHPSWLKAFGLI